MAAAAPLSHYTVMFDMCQKQLSALLLQKGLCRDPSASHLSADMLDAHRKGTSSTLDPVLLFLLLLSVFSIDAWHHFFKFHDRSD